MARQIGRRNTRQVRKTAIIVCEGKRDKAFLEFLRATFTSQIPTSVKITVQQAYGKGGNNVVTTLLGRLKNAQFDFGVAFVEADLPPDTKHSKEIKALSRGCSKLLIIATPSLEGLFLKILNRPYSSSTEACKRVIEDLSGTDLFDPNHYHSIFSREIITSYVLGLSDNDDFKKMMNIYLMR